MYKLVLHSTQDWTEEHFHSFSMRLDKPSCEKLCFDIFHGKYFLHVSKLRLAATVKPDVSGACKLNLSTGVSSWTMEMQYLFKIKNAVWWYEIIRIVPKNNSLQQQRNSEMYSSLCTLLVIMSCYKTYIRQRVQLLTI